MAMTRAPVGDGERKGWGSGGGEFLYRAAQFSRFLNDFYRLIGQQSCIFATENKSMQSNRTT